MGKDCSGGEGKGGGSAWRAWPQSRARGDAGAGSDWQERRPGESGLPEGTGDPIAQAEQLWTLAGAFTADDRRATSWIEGC